METDRARQWLNEQRKPLVCIYCQKESNFGPWAGMQYCEKAPNQSGHVYEMTLDPDAEVKLLAAYGQSEYEQGQRDAREAFVGWLRDRESEGFIDITVDGIINDLAALPLRGKQGTA